MTGGQTYGRYRVERRLGQGGMGEVFAATDTTLNRPAAVKLVSGPLASDPEFRTRFAREADALARLDSPHVIAIYDHGEQDGVPYIATQLVAGGDLDGLLSLRGPLPLATAAAICAQVADALHDAHRIGIVHRDVKSSNVLVRDPRAAEPFVYLCDFGIAVSEEAGTRLTNPGGVAGSWAYLSPERAAGAEATPASDLYALGCLLWTCLTGRPPYEGTAAQVVMAHRDAPVPQLPDADTGVDGGTTGAVNAVLATALAKNPADRYESAAAMREDLLEVARGGGHVRAAVTTAERPATPATVVRDTPAPTGRRRWLVPVLAAVLALAVAGAVAVVVLGGDDDPGPADDPAAPGPEETEAVTGDVDGDGYGDVVIAQRRASNLRPLAELTWLSTGLELGPVQEAPPVAEGDVHLADLDGDGVAERVYEGGYSLDGSLELTVVPDDGGDPWTAKIVAPSDATFPAQAFGDVDGDGRDDLMIAYGEQDRGSVFVALSEGDGFAEPEQWFAGTDSWYIAEFVAGDYTGDGLDDLVVVVPDVEDSSETWYVVASDGGSFSVPGEPYVLRSAGRALGTPLAGDVDGDGADELVILGAAQRKISVWEVQDATVQQFRVWFDGLGDDAEVQTTFNVATISDLDGDGDDDLVWVDRPGGGDGDLLGVISDGSAFADPVPWGDFTCDEECGDGYTLATAG